MIEENIFDSLNLPIPDIIKNSPIEIQREVFEYLNGMTKLEKEGFKLAFSHLGSSFDILRSNGFKKWKQSKTLSK